MNRRVCFVGSLAVLLLVWLASTTLWAKGYVEGELLIKYKPEATVSARKTLNQRHALKVLRSFDHLGISHLKLPEGTTVKDAIKTLKLDAHVAFVEPNYRRNVRSTPNDAQWSSQWALRQIQMPYAWEVTQGSADVIVAVVDTGVYAHPDLLANIWRNTGETDCNDGIDNDGNGKIDDCRGWNFYDANNNTDDDDGHGTHVAGIIGAVGNNSIGVSGVAWNVRIMPVRFIGASGGSISDEIAAIQYAVQNGAKIINASFGCDTDYPEDCTFSLSEYEAIRDARDAGVIFIAAAGNGWNNNDGAVQNYPSSYCVEQSLDGDTYPGLSNIISVAAAEPDDNLADYSNWGATSVHIAAPGSDILSTSINPSYESLSGTSMAAGFVSGAAAMLLAAKPDATMQQLKTTLLSSADTVASLDSLVSTGGRLNVYKAVLSIQPAGAIPLAAGWNFISLPRQPPDTAIATVLSPVLSHVRVAWGFDNQLKIWKRFKPLSDTTLSTMEQGKGYWVFLDGAGTIDMTGWSLPTVTLSLTAGWNLVGFSGVNDANAESVLRRISGSWEILWSWEEGMWSATHESGAQLPVPSVETFQRGKAYWLKVPGGASPDWTQ
jgi:subtilisin family serine protease